MLGGTPRRAQAAFTLVEVLVTLLILGIIGTALTRVMVKQQQAYRDSAKEADMAREIRLTSSLLPSELRSTSSSGGDVLEMDEDKVTFLANIGSSIVCAKVSNTHVVLPPLNTAGITTTNWYSQPSVGDSVMLYNDSLSAGSEDDVWTRRPINSFTSGVFGLCPGAPYTDPVLDASKQRFMVGIGAAGTPDSVKVGAVVRFARPVRYSIYAASSGRWYVGYQEYLNGAWTAIEAVGGPYNRFLPGDANPSGLQFRYFDSTGVRLFNVADRLSVSRVDVYLRANGGVAAVTERQPNLLRDSVMMRIAVRNFK
jgi:prepilin-type N-terminal cleavage/methylation domain-containing protein